MINEMINIIRKTKNKIFAMLAAVPAIPPKPNIAAMIAMTRNITAQRNMLVLLRSRAGGESAVDRAFDLPTDDCPTRFEAAFE
jgi:hypothetical protein